MVLRIEKAEYQEGLKIRFQFSKGVRRVVDFGPFLKKAKNPMSQKYVAPENFRNYPLENGDIHWNEFELCFPIWDLYEGKTLGG